MHASRLSFLLFAFAFLQFSAAANPGDSTKADKEEQAAILAYLDSADKAMPYQRGAVKLRSFATLSVPTGYKFLPEKEAQWLVEKLWGNPADASVMGMLVPERFSLNGTDGWGFVLTYDESGYVKDDDAADIDYADLQKEMQADEAETNKERTAGGYPAIHFKGWASTPYYDAKSKVLHWAKELQFEGSEGATLNYDVRILGRKGVLSMNAVGSMDQLAEIKKAIPDILPAAVFSDGYQYKDFDPNIDKVAAYTVGGLVAGKILAKVGLFALLLKNIKLVILAIVGLFAAFRNRIAGLFRRKQPEDEFAYATAPVGDAQPILSLPEEAGSTEVAPNEPHQPTEPKG